MSFPLHQTKRNKQTFSVFSLFVCFLYKFKAPGALTYGSDGDVRTRPPKHGSFGDRLNKEKRGSFSEDKRKIGGHLVRTIKKKGSFSEESSLEKKRGSFREVRSQS